MSGWKPDWAALARHCVHETMQIKAGERVVVQGDPLLTSDFYEAIRYEILAVGAIDHAHVLGWHGRLHALRDGLGRPYDDTACAQEQKALADLLSTADVFLWLPVSMNPFGCSAGYSERALADWPGRGLHFHWFNDWYLGPDDPLQVKLAMALQRAVLELDYDAHREKQERFVEAIRGRELHIKTPEGTDLHVQLADDGWYHVNDGRVTPEKQRNAACARDREEELPCGSVRTIPVIESVDGVVRYCHPAQVDVAAVGYGMLEYAGDLTLDFRDGRIIRTSAGAQDVSWQRFWADQWGADEATELVFGTNPHLHEIPGLSMLPYWGFGEGYVRIHTGSNTESGGDREASLSLELWQRQVTMTADGDDVIVAGTIVV